MEGSACGYVSAYQSARNKDLAVSISRVLTALDHECGEILLCPSKYRVWRFARAGKACIKTHHSTVSWLVGPQTEYCGTFSRMIANHLF